MDIRVIKTKAAIKASFKELLKREPIEKITVSEICNNADINRVTFYTHYQDKYDLLIDYLNNITEEIYDKATASISGINEKEQLICFFCNLFNCTIDYCVDHAEIFKFFPRQSNTSLLTLIDKTATKNILSLFKKIFKDTNMKYSYDFIVYFIIGGCNKLLFEYFEKDNEKSVTELKYNANKLITELINSNILFDKN